MNWLQGLAIGVGSVGVLWLLVRTLLKHFRPQIVKWIIKNGLKRIIDYIDDGLDWIRDNKDKGTAKELREMANEVFQKAPKVSQAGLYDGD